MNIVSKSDKMHSYKTYNFFEVGVSQTESNNASGIEATEHKNVLYKGMQYRRGEVEIAANIQEQIGVPVIIEAKPYLHHAVQYTVIAGGNAVKLDFYASAPGRGYDVEDVVTDVRIGLKQASQ